ncbi:MAG TPA: type II toxin-antitoxin system HicB family antitoxin [Fimbriimonas sp.]|nr:type II toxin-antitoxin system HicB family antitoxin [Fimbriimonas sp.]
MANQMLKYEMILYWSEEDAAFVVEVPELAGCMADGQTPQEALANAQVVATAWVETAQSMGRTIPVPRGRLTFA